MLLRGLLHCACVKQLGGGAGKLLDIGAFAGSLGGIIGRLRSRKGGGVDLGREIRDVAVQHAAGRGFLLVRRCCGRLSRDGSCAADAGAAGTLGTHRLYIGVGGVLRCRVLRLKLDDSGRLRCLGRQGRRGVMAAQCAVLPRLPRRRQSGRGRCHRRRGVKVQHRLKISRVVGIPCGRCAAAQREPDRIAAALGSLRHHKQRAVMPGAEGDAGVGQLQAEQTAAQQIQNLVADEGVVHIGRQGAGHSPAPVADQHKGALADAGGHVGGGKVRAGHLHGGQRTACSGLHDITGEALEQLLRHGNAAGLLGIGIALGAEVKDSLAVGQGLQQCTQQAAGRLVHGYQQLALFQQGVQRGLGQARFALGKDIITELGAQPRGPFFTVLLRHGAVGGADLHTDGKFTVPFQQTQAGAAVIPDAPQHRGYLRARRPENTQDFQLSVDHGGTFLCLEMLPSLSVGADSISARGSFLQPQTGRAHIECAPTVLRFKYLNLCLPSPG